MCNFSWDYSQKFFHKKCDKENFPVPSHPHGCGGGVNKNKTLVRIFMKVCSRKKFQKEFAGRKMCADDRPRTKKILFVLVVAWGLLKLVVFKKNNNGGVMVL